MYAPLKAIEDMCNLQGQGQDLNTLLGLIYKDVDADLNDILKFACSLAIANPYYDDPRFLPLKERILKNYYDSYTHRKSVHGLNVGPCPVTKFPNGKMSMSDPGAIKSFQNIFCVPLILSKWSKNKQVYKPDEEFINALSKTDNMVFDRSIFRQLPVDTFYIDFGDIEIFGPDAIGCFVTTINTLGQSDSSYVGIIYLNNGGSTSYSSIYVNYEEDGKFQFTKNENQIFMINHGTNKSCNVDVNGIDAFVMQLLLYLTSEEPDIEEDRITKSSYKPSSKVKNKFSEIQRWEVGIRYGKAMRLYKQEIKKREKKEKDPDIPADKKERKPVRPHWRNAHWHHFWTGKRDTDQRKLICKWLPPTLVGEGETDIVINRAIGKAETKLIQ